MKNDWKQTAPEHSAKKNLNFPGRRWKTSRRFCALFEASRATGKLAGSKSIMEWWKVLSGKMKKYAKCHQRCRKQFKLITPMRHQFIHGLLCASQIWFLFIHQPRRDVCELTADIARGRSCFVASGFATKSPVLSERRGSAKSSIEMSFESEKKFMKIKFNFDTIFAFECKTV